MMSLIKCAVQRGAGNVAPQLLTRLPVGNHNPNLRVLVDSRQKRQSRWFSSADTAAVVLDDDTPMSVVKVPRFAVVTHAAAYAAAMNGLHGQQLALAQLEGQGKDEPDFDPFLEEELEEARLLAESEERKYGGRQSPSEKVEEDDDESEIQDWSEPAQETDTSSPLFQHRLNRKKYKNDGSLKRNKSELAILRAGAPAGGMVAVIALAGTQHKVTTDDVLIVNRLKPVTDYAVGSIVTLRGDQVLLVTSTSMTLVGMPYVSGAEVDVLVEELTRDAKVIIFKKRRRKNSQRKTGFRRDVTMLRVLDIRFPVPYDTHEHLERAEPAPLVSKNVKIKCH